MRDIFLSFLKSGLWGRPVKLPDGGSIDWDALYQIAQEQAVIGLIADGIEYSIDSLKKSGIIPDTAVFRRIIAQVIDIERTNLKMNEFIFALMRSFTDVGVYSLVVKGQGVGQSYLKPEHRTSGDIDLLVRKSEYERIKIVLSDLIDGVDSETLRLLHLAAHKGSFVIELHGTLQTEVKNSIDRHIALMQEQMFLNRDFTMWNNVLLPSHEFNAVFIFSHILQHFFKGGIGFRQICDWCRFLYVHKDTIDPTVLMQHLKKMGILSDWRCFSNMVVRYLGMPDDAMPFYTSNCNRRGDKVLGFLFSSGNFGRLLERDTSKDTSYIRKKWNSFFISLNNMFFRIGIFPVDTCKSYIHYFTIASSKFLRGK